MIHADEHAPVAGDQFVQVRGESAPRPVTAGRWRCPFRFVTGRGRVHLQTWKSGFRMRRAGVVDTHGQIERFHLEPVCPVVAGVTAEELDNLCITKIVQASPDGRRGTIGLYSEIQCPSPAIHPRTGAVPPWRRR